MNETISTGALFAIIASSILFGWLMSEWGKDLRLKAAKRKIAQQRQSIARKSMTIATLEHHLVSANDELRSYRKANDDAVFLLITELGATEIKSSLPPRG